MIIGVKSKNKEVVYMIVSQTKKIVDRNFPLSEYLKDDEYTYLLDTAQYKGMSKGQIMQSDTSECSGVPLILSGELRLFSSSQSGREMSIYRVESGQMCLIAALCILTDEPFDFSVCAEANTEMLVINSSVFKNLMFKNINFNKYILSLLADRLIHSLTLHEKVHLTSVNDKLVEYLYDRAIDGVLNTTHEKIAQDLGTSRVVISRAIGKLRDQGMVETSRNKIIIKDM